MNTVNQGQASASGSLVELLKILQEINTAGPMAKTNEESISDNNGGRIIL